MLNLIRPTLMGTAAPLASTRIIAARNFSGSMVMAKKKVIDPTLPLPPKGPPSAYTLFYKEYVLDPSHHNRNAQGKLDMQLMTTNAGKEWNNLPSTQKSEFESKALGLRREYEKVYKAFWDATTHETRTEIEKVTGKTLKPPGGKKAYNKTISERSGNPGKPLTPYFAFAKEIRDSNQINLDHLSGTEKITHLAKETGKLWKELSEDAQKTYKDAYVTAKAKWDEWKITQKDL